jgi:hypothetical protein
MSSSNRLEDLRDEARYHRERRDLYRAKMHGGRPTSPARLRELERTLALADSRLQRAERDTSSERDTGSPKPVAR